MTSLAENASLCLLIVSFHRPGHLKQLLNWLSTTDITTEKILKIIQTLDQNKTRGHDDISVRMIKICWSWIIKLLQLLFNNCVKYRDLNYLPCEKKGAFPNPLSANLTKWSNQSFNSSVITDELFECVWSFCGFGV